MGSRHLKYRAGLLAVLFAAAFLATGCRIKLNEHGNTKIVLTTGFDKDEVFRIDKASCRLPEVMVYLTNMKNQYEQALGSRSGRPPTREKRSRRM